MDKDPTETTAKAVAARAVAMRAKAIFLSKWGAGDDAEPEPKAGKEDLRVIPGLQLQMVGLNESILVSWVKNGEEE